MPPGRPRAAGTGPGTWLAIPGGLRWPSKTRPPAARLGEAGEGLISLNYRACRADIDRLEAACPGPLRAFFVGGAGPFLVGRCIIGGAAGVTITGMMSLSSGPLEG